MFVVIILLLLYISIRCWLYCENRDPENVTKIASYGVFLLWSDCLSIAFHFGYCAQLWLN